MHATSKLLLPIVLAGMALLASNPAYALRCGSKLVKEGMHEIEVKAICGRPVSEHSLGFVIRTHFDRTYGSSRTRYYGGYPNEVLVTEHVYNFGPRKLMRRLRFEDGFLVSIETIGYGYRQDRK
jgi:hypothetical protein